MDEKTNLIHKDMHNQIVGDFKNRLATAQKRNYWLEDKLEKQKAMYKKSMDMIEDFQDFVNKSPCECTIEEPFGLVISADCEWHD